MTILKVWCDESFVTPDPVVPNSQGTGLVAYTGPAAGSLTVGGELNEVAANIAMGRNFAGRIGKTNGISALAPCQRPPLAAPFPHLSS